MPKLGLGQALRNLFRNKKTIELYDELEDLLLESDIGPVIAMSLRDMLEKGDIRSEEIAIQFLKDAIRPYIKAAEIPIVPNKPNFILFLGVNGVGKTTSLAKMAYYFKKNKNISKIVCACGDTFRAAATDQLTIYSQRVGFRVVKSAQGADPGSVIFDAITSALTQQEDLILADTAGRMHNRTELMHELVKIDKIIRSRIDESAYHRILVIDATTGQNGVCQAEVFQQAMQLSGVIVTKYDSGCKAGSLVSIGKNLGLPIFFVGTGEGMEDFAPFHVEPYLTALFS